MKREAILIDTIQKIATALGETEEDPLKTIKRIVKVLGEERALALLEETLEIEARGGMTVDDGSRKRSPGGVFFKLTKTQTKSRERWLIFSDKRPVRPKPKPQPPVTWEEIEQLSTELLRAEKGEISTVKLTLIGQPDRIIEKGEVVLTSMQTGAKTPSLPKGLPKPPTDPTTYLVFIAMKQWRKVRGSINKNPDDKLIVEGYPVFDKRIGEQGTMCLYAQFVTTKLIQQAKREAQKATAKD